MASVTDKYLKEIDDLVLIEELDNEAKIEFITKQIEGFQTQAYRFQVDAQLAKEYIRIGEEGKVADADKYIETGQAKALESVGHLRSLKVNLELLCRLRNELQK
jgi:ethanolamine ammonia-lyase large subunit